MNLQTFIDRLAEKRKYRPLPIKLKERIRNIYRRRVPVINPNDCLVVKGKTIATKIERIVVGDYGAFIEIAEDDFIGTKTVPTNQTWRLNKSYLERAGLTIKYEWYEVEGKKLYFQVGTVKYADYKVGYYYISVLDIDCDI